MLQKTVAMAMAVAVLGMLPMGQVSAANANGAIAQGVDASKHNGAVNWGQVAASGMQFAFIKVGSTNSGVDPQFASNITGAQSAGLNNTGTGTAGGQPGFTMDRRLYRELSDRV